MLHGREQSARFMWRGVLKWCLVLGVAMVALVMVSAATGPLVSTAMALLGIGMAVRSTIRSSEGGRREFALALTVMGMAVMCYFVGTVGWQAAAKRQRAWEKATCMSNVRLLLRGMQIYLADNGNAFPPASAWCDALSARGSSRSSFVCPSAPHSACGYAFNSALSHANQAAVRSSEKGVVIFESDARWNLGGGPQLLPTVPRHQGGDVYGLVDGHMEWQPRPWLTKFEWQPAREQRPATVLPLPR